MVCCAVRRSSFARGESAVTIRSSEALSGLAKWPMEHYTTYVTDGGAARRLTASLLSYYADPFPWTYRGQLWVFAEEFRYLHDRGRIVAIPVAPSAPGTAVQVALDLPYHLSFPFLFEESGQLFMLPESRRNHTLSLFACEDFPGRWRHVRDLFSGVDAVDSVIFQHEELWWIITSLLYPHQSERSLAIFFSEDFRQGVWNPHPVNGENRYSDRAQGSGRNGGSVFKHEHNLFRVMQSSRSHYGQSTEIMQIARLTPQIYEERPAPQDVLPSHLRGKGDTHHLSVCGDHVAWDVRDRMSYRQHLAIPKRRLAFRG